MKSIEEGDRIPVKLEAEAVRSVYLTWMTYEKLPLVSYQILWVRVNRLSPADKCMKEGTVSNCVCEAVEYC